VGLPIFRSEGQARLLADLFLDENATWRSLSELARRAGLAPSTVLREVERLEASGLVETERVGNVRRVRADAGSRFHPDLRALVRKAFGPEPVLADRLGRIPGIHQAYLFGSWARRARDPEASVEPPRDLDLLVVGEPSADDVYRACADAEATLGLAIDPVIVSAGVWDGTAEDAPMRGFLAAVRADAPIALLHPTAQ